MTGRRRWISLYVLCAGMLTIVSGATPDEAGLASGLINTTAQVGGALGLAVPATLSASRSGALISEGESAALTSGYHPAFGIGAVLVAVAIAVMVLEPGRQVEEGVQAEAEPADREAA